MAAIVNIFGKKLKKVIDKFLQLWHNDTTKWKKYPIMIKGLRKMEIFCKDALNWDQKLMMVCLSVYLAGAGFWDLKKGKVPNRWLLFWFAAGFTVSAWRGGTDWFPYLIRCGVVIGIFFPFFLFRMMGAGDIKSMALICGYLGFLSGSRVIVTGLVIGAAWSLARLVKKKILWERFLYMVFYFRRIYQEKKIFAYYVKDQDGKEVTIPFVFCLAAGLAVLIFSEFLNL